MFNNSEIVAYYTVSSHVITLLEDEHGFIVVADFGDDYVPAVSYCDTYDEAADLYCYTVDLHERLFGRGTEAQEEDWA